ncbi:MAG TPA: PVC-type heme-binding CxxCH protein [Pirellulales bacterium]|nr:PVC-type heme-binding CxxCH protein [Pirellulales bacterium]
MHRFLPTLLSLLLLTGAAVAQPPVALTDPVSPAEQQKKFKLPAGFEIELVAAEPDIHKPMNLKFDAHGRLWVTHSVEYPFAAANDEAARDAITIFSDLAADGRAQKAVRFAEHLNIPIGVLPLSDRDALVWSIPNIYRLSDTTGRGAADQRTVLFGPFGVVDTHGDQNAFTRWVDGWVYANHGFSNHSQVKKAGQGDVVLDMQSGNAYRFRADGSAIEQFAWGQVNPFGLCFDPLGNLFTADCHSRAVTMVLREGHYPSFGKPHDGLGFAPETTDVDHGGTGIAGVVYYAADQFPVEFRGALFVGNVITNRVHCDRLKWTGSSPRVAAVEDFLVCDDPWFRPVDIQLGPDGALYIADFYNRIIGHYEVPLTHPGRDHEHGRIWRIVYRGPADAQKRAPLSQPAGSPAPGDLAALDVNPLIQALGHPNLTVRTLATNTLLDRHGAEAAAAAWALLTQPDKQAASTAALDAAAQRAHAIWIVQRAAAPGHQLDETLARRLAGDEATIVRVHLAEALGETSDWQSWHSDLVRGQLNDADPFVRRAAAGALALHPASDNIGPLARLLVETKADDAQLIHAARIALRDQLRSPQGAAGLAQLALDERQRQQVLAIAALTPTPGVARFFYEQILAGNVEPSLLHQAFPVAAAEVDSAGRDRLVGYLRQHFADNEDYQLDLLRGTVDALGKHGARPTPLMTATLTDLLRPAVTGQSAEPWSNIAVPGAAPSASPWVLEQRSCRDGEKNTPVVSSLREHNSAGEHLTGILHSPTFSLPPKLSFWMCGHDGPPGSAVGKRNYARLVLSDGNEIARSEPPRSDVAQRFEWDLTPLAGRSGNLEVVDADTGGAYAWIAIGRIEPAVVRIPQHAVGDRASSQADAVRLAGTLRLEGLTGPIAQIAADTDNALLKMAACEALATLRPEAAIAPLAGLLADAALPVATRQHAAELLGGIDRGDAAAALLAMLRTAPQPVAIAIATAIAPHKEGATLLLAEIRAGRATATLLREPTVASRLHSAGISNLDEQLTELTAKLSPADDRIAKLIEQRRAGFLAATPDAAAGRALFERSVCKSCHKIGNVGGAIGPALDGIGIRGLDRLLEDLLDPSRNVDQAFRVTLIETDAGQIVSGFGLREEGETLVLYDSAGKMIRLPHDEIASRTLSTLSPMPANISDMINEQEFYQLLAFLLSQRPK